MNFLDVGIILIFVAFIAQKSTLSFVYYFIISAGVFGGYILGLLLTPVAVQDITSDFKKGFVSLILLFGLALFLGFLFKIPAKKARIKVVLTKFFPFDKLFVWPYKALAFIFAIFLLSQTLIYIPILALQFEVQGSSVFTLAGKVFPETFIEQSAKKIAPYQFDNLTLEYDAEPLAHNDITNLGKFQQAVNSTFPSIVKISGKNCIGTGFGSGFVAAPNMVITNAHVLSGASSIYIKSYKGVYPATPLLIDKDYDIAVLYSHFINEQPIPIANKPTEIGTEAISLGYPSGGNLETSGVGTVMDRSYKSSYSRLDGNSTTTFDFTSLDAGSSGGPILNSNGEVIAVNVAGSAEDTIGINSEQVQNILEKAKRKFLPASTSFCEVAPKFY